MDQSIIVKETYGLERTIVLQNELERLIAEAKLLAAEVPQPITI